MDSKKIETTNSIDPEREFLYIIQEGFVHGYLEVVGEREPKSPLEAEILRIDRLVKATRQFLQRLTAR